MVYHKTKPLNIWILSYIKNANVPVVVKISFGGYYNAIYRPKITFKGK